jgi:malto-oligosyltrehalose trehalohydrolase
VTDPRGYAWQHAGWPGRPWAETVLSELHLGTVTPGGTYRSLIERLDHYVETGITAIELMPVSDFLGARGWGYDGVLPYAPDRAYGTPDDLKALVDAAHRRGLTVFLDVVYNHFGPEGNYLHLYAPQFFDEARKTPWGAGIDYEKQAVRDFFVHNALYWLREFRFDGLRFDAVDWIKDKVEQTGDEVAFLKELARRVRETVRDEDPERHVHLVLENDDNDADLLARESDGRPVYFTAQWNDDWHHAAHVALTGEDDGYYHDYSDDPSGRLCRGMAEGFVYQGEVSKHREGRRRGMPSGHLPPTCFVDFLQNHDQIGNRAYGERLTELAAPEGIEALTVALLLAPAIPLLYMGEEWGETAPFRFFCDFHDELADAVRNGRRREFRKFARFSSEEAQATIPDPNDPQTAQDSRIDWAKRDGGSHARRLELVRHLLQIRRTRIVPLIPEIARGGDCREDGRLIQVTWMVGDAGKLHLAVNASDREREAQAPEGEVLFAWPEGAAARAMPPWSAVWTLSGEGAKVPA